MKNKIIFFAIFILTFAISAFFGSKLISQAKTKKGPYLTINNQKIYLQIADNPFKRTKGLSNKKSLADNSGMLFIYQKAAKYPFWTNEMKFDLDFVFIRNNKVVYIAQNIPHPNNNKKPKTIISKRSFDKALELNAGTIKKLKIKTGDKVSFSL